MELGDHVPLAVRGVQGANLVYGAHRLRHGAGGRSAHLDERDRAHRLLVHGGVELDGEPSDHAAVEESGDPGLDRAAGHAEGGREGRDGRAGVTAEAREKGAVQVVENGWHRHNVACSGANCAINGQIFVRNDVVLTIAGRDDCPMTILECPTHEPGQCRCWPGESGPGESGPGESSRGEPGSAAVPHGPPAPFPPQCRGVPGQPLHVPCRR